MLGNELLGEELNSTYFPNRMAGNNKDESHTGRHPVISIPANPDIPMPSFRERLETLCPWNGNGSCNQVDETNLPAGVDLTNLLLLELLQKQGEQKRGDFRTNN